MKNKTSLWDKIKIVLIIFIFLELAGFIWTMLDTFKSNSTSQNISYIAEILLAIVLSLILYKPIKIILSPKTTSGKFLCIIVAIIILSFEFVGLTDTINSIFDTSKEMPKFWYLYIIGAIFISLFVLGTIRKPKYSISQLDNMEGHQFEYACADILKANGFKNVRVTQGSGDFGVDIIGEKDHTKYAIQCKCYSHKLNNTPIQEVIGGLAYYGCDKGAVMTNQYFTGPAKELAEINGIELWDRDILIKLSNKNKKSKNNNQVLSSINLEQTDNITDTGKEMVYEYTDNRGNCHSKTDSNNTIQYDIYNSMLTDKEKIQDVYQQYIYSIGERLLQYCNINAIHINVEKIEIESQTNEVLFICSLKNQTRVSQVKNHLKEMARAIGVKYAEYVYPTSISYTIGIKVPLPEHLEETSI